MDDRLLRQLVRQLRLLNIWISIFGVLILAALVTLGYFVFKIVIFVNDTNTKIDTITTQTKETLDVKGHVCKSDNVGGFLRDKTGVCETP